jgi:hypothetical protein
LQAVLPAESVTEGDSFEARFGLKPLEPLIRFRALDASLLSALRTQHVQSGLPLGCFCQLALSSCVIITENLMNFECLPDLPNTLAIWGQGNAADLLLQVNWLTDCDLYYWGDIDEHGFHILARLRARFPAIRSLLMDFATLENCRTLTGPGEPAGKAPINLTDEERQAFESVQRAGLRLEQEKIPQSNVTAALEKFFGAIDALPDFQTRPRTPAPTSSTPPPANSASPSPW